MISKVCLACFLLCYVLNWQSSYVLGLTKQEKEQDILLKLIDQSRYDKRVRPSGDGDDGATTVNVNLYVRSFDFIDDIKMEYGVSLTFRQQWMDKRLAYNAGSGNNSKTTRFPEFDFSSPSRATRSADSSITQIRYLSLLDRTQVWIPDLFFSNEKSAQLHELMRPNHYIRIFPNGEVLYSSRISMTLKCHMLMKVYPFDTQTCSMRMASYGYTNEDILFKWKVVDPVQITSDLHLERFSLEKFAVDHCDSTTNTGTYSCLRVDFVLAREISYYLLSMFIPTNMIVIVAWLGCWLDRKAVTARILIGLSTLFVMATEVSRFNFSTPKVSYTKALDVWTGMSLTFVFACLIEFVVVHYLSRLEDEQKANSSAAQESGNNEEVPLNEKHLDIEVQQPKKNIRNTAQNYMSRFPSKSQKVDAIFRIVFPIVYALFFIFYFIAY